MLRLAAVTMIVHGLVDLAVTVFMGRAGGGIFFALMNDGSLLLSMVARGLLIIAIVQFTLKTHAWVLPLLGTVAAFTVIRSALSLAMHHHLVGSELYGNPFYRFGMFGASLFNAAALLVGGLALKAAVPAAGQG